MESQVIVNQQVTVNMCRSFVHTARHGLEGSLCKVGFKLK